MATGCGNWVCLTEWDHVVVLSAHDLGVLWTASSERPPFGNEFGGETVAVGNVDADPALEIVTSSGYVYDGVRRELDWKYEKEFSERTVTLGDLDGDGVQEIIGNGVYSSGRGPIPFPARSESPWDFAMGTVADTNGDGKAELVWWDVIEQPRVHECTNTTTWLQSRHCCTTCLR